VADGGLAHGGAGGEEADGGKSGGEQGECLAAEGHLRGVSERPRAAALHGRSPCVLSRAPSLRACCSAQQEPWPMAQPLLVKKAGDCDGEGKHA
jgi:hypothetical protein